ncbi:hypothetical protein EDB81DRAFT_638805, partial [Dactylonectria macrodidyma]
VTFAGAPTAMEKSGTSCVTMLPAPIVQPLPIVTLGMMMAFPPIQQSSPISSNRRRDAISVSCVTANSDTLGPKSTLLPSLTMPQSRMQRLVMMVSFLCKTEE